MIILGIHDGHTATACIMKDGKIIAAISEERLVRKKNEMGYPKNAIDACLKYSKIKPNEIDLVAVSTINLNMLWAKIKRESAFTINDYIREQHEYFKPLLIEGKSPGEVTWKYIKNVEDRKGVMPSQYDFSILNESNFSDNNVHKKIRIDAILKHLKISEDKIHFVDHHACHAYFAYYSSPFRGDTLILTIDGFGDGNNATISVSRNNKIERIFATNECKIATIYKYITLLLGMKPTEHEYKVMGLAPYSNSKELERSYRVFSDIFEINDLNFVWKNKPKDLYFHFLEKLEGCRFDGIAAAVQKMVEDLCVKWVRNAIKKTGINKVVLAGGVAMNIKLNLLIAKMPEVSSLFIGPSPADESTPIGACYYVMEKYCEKNNISGSIIAQLDHAYLGTEFTKEDILNAIKKTGVDKKYKIETNINNKEIAKELVNGKVIGVCRGRMEFGARALGNRSILADPSNPNIIQKINSQIKFRDFWMPFTPSILFERCDDYIINDKRIYSPFMTIGFDSTPLAQKEIIASLHPADLTARPQMVRKDINPDYYDLIKEFEKITGIGAVLNTSLNLHGLPVVCSPEDAIEVMEKSEIDMIYFGDVLITRK